MLSDQLGERRLVTCTEALDETRVAALHRSTVTKPFDIVGALASALKLGVTVDNLALMHDVYPSYSEGLKAAAENALVPVRA